MKKLNKKAILTITGIALPLGAAAILIPRLRSAAAASGPAPDRAAFIPPFP